MCLIVGMDEREDDVHLHEVIPCVGKESPASLQDIFRRSSHRIKFCTLF